MNKRNVLFLVMALMVMVMSGCLTTGSQEVVEVNVVPSNPAPFAWPQEGLQGMGKGAVRKHWFTQFPPTQKKSPSYIRRV